MIRDTSAQDSRVTAPPSARWRRPLRLGAISAAVFALLGWSLWQWAGSARAVSAERLRFSEVTRGTLVRDASVNGRIVAANSPTLYSPAAGVVSLKIKAGDSVQLGQLLASIDSPELANELARERATAEQLQAEVSRQAILARKASLLAKRDAEEAEVTRLAALRDLQRAERGFKLGAIAEVDYLRAKDALQSAQIRSQHAGTAAGLESQDVALALTTQRQLLARQQLVVAELERRVDGLHVRAPVAGIVGTLAVAERAALLANAPLMTVVDLSQLEVELEIPETYADDLGLGMAAEVRIGAITANGKLSAISPEVVGNQVLARVRFDQQQPEGLRQNQRVTARVLFEEKPDVLLLARGPFLEAQGGRFAYVMQNGIAVRRPVSLGATSISAIEVLSGLKPGERVVIAGTETFADGERIAVND